MLMLCIPPLNKDIIFDLEKDEDEILRRYETIFRTLVANNVCKPLDRRFDESDVGKNIQLTILDWSVNHAIQGEHYIEEIQQDLQYTAVQSALILTISMPLYIDPTSISPSSVSHFFSAVIGIAAFSQLTVIVGCKIVAALLSRPFTASDTMIARIRGLPLIMVLNYLATLMAVTAIFVAGFARSYEDGYVQLYAILILIGLCSLFAILNAQGSHMQDMRSLRFYQKYCDINGRLKREYLLRIYANDTRT
jgi:hypothetical protein